MGHCFLSHIHCSASGGPLPYPPFQPITSTPRSHLCLLQILGAVDSGSCSPCLGQAPVFRGPQGGQPSCNLTTGGGPDPRGPPPGFSSSRRLPSSSPIHPAHPHDSAAAPEINRGRGQGATVEEPAPSSCGLSPLPAAVGSAAEEPGPQCPRKGGWRLRGWGDASPSLAPPALGQPCSPLTSPRSLPGALFLPRHCLLSAFLPLLGSLPTPKSLGLSWAPSFSVHLTCHRELQLTLMGKLRHKAMSPANATESP